MNPITKNDLPNQLSSPQEVERYAVEGNYPILYTCIQVGQQANMTWEETMQMAAIVQAAQLKLAAKMAVDGVCKATLMTSTR